MLSPAEKFGFEKAENINCVSYCKTKGETSRAGARVGGRWPQPRSGGCRTMTGLQLFKEW